MQNFYLILNLICLGFPLVLSFDKNVRYFSNWKFVFIAIILNALIFIPWDMYFTGIGVWGFNKDYLVGIEIFQLPLEEVLFFVTVPFACIFIYECVLFYLMKFVHALEAKLSWIYLIIFNAVSIVLMLVFAERLYTVFVICVALIILNLSCWKYRKYVALSLISFIIICLPFLIINGALTGSFTDAPVVWYNSLDISEIRIGTIPIEDVYYNLLLVIGSFFFYLGAKKVLRN